MSTNKKFETVEIEVLTPEDIKRKQSRHTTMEETPNKIVLILIIVFLGVFGVDKLYVSRMQNKEAFILALIKLVTSFILIGVIWNVVDLVFAAIDKYRLNPLDYIIYRK